MIVNSHIIVYLMTWMGLNINKKKDSVASDFIYSPEGLTHLVTKDADGIDAKFHNYQNRVIARESFTVERIQVNMLKSLMYCV